MATTDPIERAKDHARQMYPEATVTTRSVRGRLVVLATTDNLIRLVSFKSLDASPSRKTTKKELDSTA